MHDDGDDVVVWKSVIIREEWHPDDDNDDISLQQRISIAMKMGKGN